MMPHTATRMRSCILSRSTTITAMCSPCYSVNGVTSAEDKALLRAALTSFTPDESLRWTTDRVPI